jgi:uncharacterized integral membrane protein
MNWAVGPKAPWSWRDMSDLESVAMSNVTEKEHEPEKSGGVLRTRLSASWTGVVIAAGLLILLILFIAQNTQRSSVNFLWFHGTAPTAVVLLIAAAAGALIVIIVAVARIVQLRRAAPHSET